MNMSSHDLPRQIRQCLGFPQNRVPSTFPSEGVVHERSCIQKLQRNGILYRKHRHLLDVTWALKLQSHVADSFQGECILTTTYLINILPSQILNNKYNIYFTNHHLYHILECLGVFVTPHRNKFAPRATLCVFTIYPFTKKGYKLYDTSSKNSLLVELWFFMKIYSPFYNLNLFSSTYRTTSLIL